MAAHQQVGAFVATNVNDTIVKQGGNVASYFCTPEGRVIHAVIGPVGADELLREANWALTAWDKGKKRVGLGLQQRELSLAHQGELPPALQTNRGGPANGKNNVAAAMWGNLSRLVGTQPQKVHQLLTEKPLAPLEDIYVYVFEQILGERVSSAPNVELAEQGLQYAEDENRPMLFILHDARENSVFKEQWLAWLKSKEHRNPILVGLMRQCVVIMLPQREMPALSKRLKQEPFKLTTQGSPAFVVTDARGKQLASLTGLQSLDQLNLPLAKAIVAEIKLAPPQSVAKLKDIAFLIKRIDPALAAELEPVIEEVTANQRNARYAKNGP
ncbi:MAG: hypothetical protein K8R36_25325 [Planctomycetales bacterium]|nr:hypothetical protein [Planctomycetales bacterium]